MRRGLKWPEPHEPTAITDAEWHAIKAMNAGKATEVQQRMFLDALKNICGFSRPAYVPGDSHATAFADGKKFVWHQLVAAVVRPVPEKKRET